jgi:hypothetical protein
MRSSTRRHPFLLLLALVVHAGVTAVVWRDIDARPAAGLRGSRRLWKAVTAANTGNSLVYLLVGRRRLG